MRVEIIELTTIYPEVFVVREGTFNLNTLTADVICRCHIDEAETMKQRLNG